MSLLGRVNEHIYIFPLPTFNSPIKNVESIENELLCLSYQFDVDIYGYGPYGFCTDRAKKILNEVFGSLYYWNVEKQNLVIKNVPTESGIYFYDDPAYLDVLYDQLCSYQTKQKKNKLLEKRGRPILSIPQEPLLLELYDDGLVDGDFLEHILQDCTSFFIRHFYTPEAGDTLVLFDKNVVDKVKIAATHENVELFMVDSFNDLKQW